MSKSALLDLVPDARRKTVLHEEDGRRWIESRSLTVFRSERCGEEIDPGALSITLVG